MGDVSIIGLDLATSVFQLHGARADGSVAFRRKLSRGKLLEFFATSAGIRSRPAAGIFLTISCSTIWRGEHSGAARAVL